MFKLTQLSGDGEKVLREDDDVTLLREFAREMVKHSRYPNYFTCRVHHPDGFVEEYTR